MDSEILIRTSKSEYTGGETIYGAVYLKITNPTAAFGVWIQFCGYEKFDFLAVTKNDDAITDFSKEDNYVHELIKYLPSDNVILYDFGGPISFGQYVLPFCKQLPLDLPGSTEIKWKCGQAEVIYQVKASLIGADSITATQKLVIKQPSLLLLLCSNNCAEMSVPGNRVAHETRVCEIRTLMPFLSTQLEITTSIDKTEYVSGENLKLKLHVNVNGSFRPNIVYLSFKLLRETQIASKKFQEIGYVIANDVRHNWGVPFGGSPLTDSNITCVNPEGQTVIIWDSGRLYDKTGSLLNKGFDELLIPLNETDGQDLPSTTMGHHIMVVYSIKVEIVLQRNDPIILTLPVHCVWQRSIEWQKWKPPDWLYNCQVLSSDVSPYRVSHEILGSTEFSSLPSFQIV